ncbi:hypothetical protein BDQ17DRAFT_1235454 [Cyathus striatus]|nr:hypothetical protein BDQ17DRAFT_1235454 [Cyathus striatus]
MSSWLITGASRGIGLSLAETLLKDSNNFVVATARNPDSAPGLAELKAKYSADRLAVIKLDVTSDASVAEAVKEVEVLLPNGLDYLVSNAGIHPQPITPFSEIDLVKFAEEVTFNAVVPVRVARPLLPLIQKSEKKKIIIVSSALGSIELGSTTFPGLSNTYSISKAALNMLGRKWGAELKPAGVTVALIHPGWVQTEIGDGIAEWMHKNAPSVPQITPTESTEGLINVAKSVTLESTTSFYNYDGTPLPW